jgi:ABC-type multidrug transport system ATPase subunit
MVLNVSGLSKNYGSLCALSDFNLEVEKGQILGILGPNGSGKTTALGILLGATLPTHGSYRWFDERKPLAVSRKKIGSILEQPNFYPWLSAQKNLEIVARIKSGKNKKITAAEIQAKLKTVGLFDRRDDYFKEFSLGMKQRLALAAALLGDPEVLVLDEPTNGLDAEAIAEIRTLILKVASEGKTVLLASHILDEVEKICSHILILQKGKTLATGSIQQVLNSGNAFELAAENLETLWEQLDRFPGFKKKSKKGAFFLVEFAPQVTSSQINKFAFENGVVLTHITRQSLGLETQFLKLLEQTRA